MMSSQQDGSAPKSRRGESSAPKKSMKKKAVARRASAKRRSEVKRGKKARRSSAPNKKAPTRNSTTSVGGPKKKKKKTKGSNWDAYKDVIEGSFQLAKLLQFDRMGKVEVFVRDPSNEETKVKGILVVNAMKEHFELIDAERAVFSDKDGVTTLRWFEDLTNIKDEGTREAKIMDVNSVFTKVTVRKEAINQLIAQWSPGNEETAEEAKNQARAFVSLMEDHIPEMLRNEVNIKKRVKNAIRNGLMMDKELKRARIEALIKHKKIDEERRIYIESFEYGTISEAAQLDPFFEKPFRSISQGTIVEMVETTTNIVERMVEIRDLGGTWKDVERASAHIPEALLPDKIVKACQGYRKVDRELQYERLIKKYKNEPMTATDIIEAVNTAGTTFAAILGNPLAGDGDPKSWAFGDDAYFTYKLVVSETTTVKAEVETLLALKNSQSPDIWSTMQRITLALNNINSGVASFKSLPQIASFAAANPTSSVADFVGVADSMGPIGSAISLISAFYDLYKLKGERDQAALEYDEQRKKFYLGLEGAPDQALYNAVVNEKGAKDRQLRKAQVDAAASTLSTAGGFANLSAVGAVAGGALVATGSAIKLGNKVVFACIDWSNANAAKQMIDLARAGSRSARIEVFNKSGFYAKMLLCVLAKEGHEFAYQFIVVRGFCEEGLNGPHALYILRSALMKKAGQEDDPESDSAFRGALDFFSKAGKALAREHATRVESVELTKANFEQMAEALGKCNLKAKKAPLETIGRALGSLDTQLTKSKQDAMSVKPQKGLSSEVKEKVVRVLKETLSRIAAVHGALNEFVPMAANGVPQEEMINYMGNIRNMLISEERDIKDHLLLLKLVDPTWNSKGTADSTIFKDVFAAADKKCPLFLPDSTAVNGAIKTYNTAHDSMSEGDNQKKRQALKKTINSGMAVLEALEDFRKECFEIIGMEVYVDYLIQTHYRPHLQGLQKQHSNPSWADCPVETVKGNNEPILDANFQPVLKEKYVIDFTKMEDSGSNRSVAKSYEEVHDDAKNKAYVHDKSSSGVLKALKAWTKFYQEEVDPHQPNLFRKSNDSRKKGRELDRSLTKRMEQAVGLLVDIAEECASAVRKNQDGHQLMSLYINGIGFAARKHAVVVREVNEAAISGKKTKTIKAKLKSQMTENSNIHVGGRTKKKKKTKQIKAKLMSQMSENPNINVGGRNKKKEEDSEEEEVP